MAEQQEPNIFEPGVRALYVEKLSRLSFQPMGDLREALKGLYNEEAQHQMGRSALILYSHPQVERLRPGSVEYRRSEQRDSSLRKKLGAISTRQFDLAKWLGLVRNKRQTATGISFNVLLDIETQKQLHTAVNDGLNQSLFGRPTVFATLWVPDRGIVASGDEWHAATQEIKRVVWGNDDRESASRPRSTPAEGGGAKVTSIDWTSPPIKGL